MPHGGESRVDVAERSVPVVEELVAELNEWGSDEAGDASDRPVVVVAHGLLHLLGAVKGLDMVEVHKQVTELKEKHPEHEHAHE